MRYLPDWAPGAGFKKKAAAWRAKMEEFVDKPYEHLLQRMVSVGVFDFVQVINRDINTCVSVAGWYRFAMLLHNASRGRSHQR